MNALMLTILGIGALLIVAGILCGIPRAMWFLLQLPLQKRNRAGLCALCKGPLCENTATVLEGAQYCPKCAKRRSRYNFILYCVFIGFFGCCSLFITVMELSWMIREGTFSWESMKTIGIVGGITLYLAYSLPKHILLPPNNPPASNHQDDD
jgi:hypothetical protein